LMRQVLYTASFQEKERGAVLSNMKTARHQRNTYSVFDVKDGIYTGWNLTLQNTTANSFRGAVALWTIYPRGETSPIRTLESRPQASSERTEFHRVCFIRVQLRSLRNHLTYPHCYFTLQ
jgi:hypothetical protein